MEGEREAETGKAVGREGWGERKKERYLNNSLR